MKTSSLLLVTIFSFSFLSPYAQKPVNLGPTEVEVVNRKLIKQDTYNGLALNNKPGDGMAILTNVNFNTGTVELEIKGENKPGRSFVGFAFNIQNDSTYEAIYFRPFNFQAKEQIKREHSMQYISHPKNTWRYLRTNFEGQYEAKYPRKPSPNEWFAVSIIITEKEVTVHDKETGDQLLKVERIEKPISPKIGIWTGNNSKGEFRNLILTEK